MLDHNIYNSAPKKSVNFFRHQQHEETSLCDVECHGCCKHSSDEYYYGRKKTISSPFDDTTDMDLAKEMNDLSVTERERVYDELHGVAQPHKETPEFVAQLLQEFDKVMAKIPKTKRRWLDKAIFLRPSWETDPKFKLLFLRADEYDVKAACKRMVKHFDIKSQLFGPENIAKDITLDDLTEGDIQVGVLSGCSLGLANRDQTGRPIIVYDVTKFDHNFPQEMCRYTWYLSMTTLDNDEVAQIKGVTNLSYAPWKPKDHPSNNVPFAKVAANMKMSGNMVSSIPIRITGYHYLTNDPKMNFILGLINLSYGKQVRLRTRTHFGSILEMQYSLLTFGIHYCESLLTNEEGKTPLHDDYLKRRKRIEDAKAKKLKEQEVATGMALYPTPKDVLIGRGRPYHEYDGTRKLIEMIDLQLDRYYDTRQEEDRLWKTVINMEMVKNVKEYGGRFLQRVNQRGWKILDDAAAREKTANLFRYRHNLLTKNNSGGKDNQRMEKTLLSLRDGGHGGKGRLAPKNGSTDWSTKKRLRDDSLDELLRPTTKFPLIR